MFSSLFLPTTAFNCDRVRQNPSRFNGIEDHSINNRILTTTGRETGLTSKNRIVNNHLSEQEAGMRFALLEAVRNGRYRQTKLLVEANADLNGQDESGATSLILCCTHLPDAKARTKFTRLLLDANADPNIQDKNGMSALMHATVLGQPDVVLMLLDHNGSDLDLKDNEGNTALMYAAAFGHPDIVKYLLNEMGRLKQVIHLSQRNYKGMTAMQLAEDSGHHNVAIILGKERPGFPMGASDREFPDPSQLDRGPTPGSPLKSFPVRWQQRKVLEKCRNKQKKNSDTESENSKEKLQIEPSQEVLKNRNHDDMAKKLHGALSLPKLPVKDMSGAAGTNQPTTDNIKSINETLTADKEIWNHQLTTDNHLVVPPPSRRSHSEPRSSRSTTSTDRFTEVLNLLDASILDDQDSSDNDEDNEAERKWRRYLRPQIKRDQALQGKYFPPIRPFQMKLL